MAASDRSTDLDNTISQKKQGQDVSFGNEELAFSKLSRKDIIKCIDNTKMQIKADWKLLTCSNAVKGDLRFEVMTGITNESEYIQEFERAVGGAVEGGMEFGLGPVIQETGGGERKHAFESSWSTSVDHQTVDTVACEVFGGTWCMWQWHITFSQCHQMLDWDSPHVKCSRGMAPPGVPDNTVELGGIKQSTPKSASLLTTSSLMNYCLFVVMILSAVIGSYLVVCLRRLSPRCAQREDCSERSSVSKSWF